MRRFISTLFMVMALTISGFASGGEVDCPITDYRTYHDNGQVRLEATVNCDNEFHGTFIEYLADGSVWGYGEYIDGLRHGKWIMKDIYGEGQYISTYDNGKIISAERQELVNGEMKTVEVRFFDQEDNLTKN